jgi:glutamyl-tRNA synthetase
MLNFLGLLGWSIGEDRTVFSVDEAVAAFDLTDVSKNPAVFDLDKLAWINGEYIRALDADVFATQARGLIESGLGRPLDSGELESWRAMAPLVQERTKLLVDIPAQVSFLYGDVEYDEQSWGKVMEKDGVGDLLAAASDRLREVEPFDASSIDDALRAMLEDLGVGARKGLQPLRVAITGSAVSPPLFESIAALGRERTLDRLTAAKKRL